MDHVSTREDLASAMALGKTVVFLLYSVLVVIALVPVVFWSGGGGVSSSGQTAIVLLVLLASEVALFYGVVTGKLPGSSGWRAEPFSEKQFGIGITVLSLGAWLLVGHGLEGRIIRWVLNGALLLGVAVYFVTKSVLSRRVRWGVLSVLSAPALGVLWDTLRGDV